MDFFYSLYCRNGFSLVFLCAVTRTAFMTTVRAQEN